MKVQWALIFGILFALIVAVFAVINVDPVTVNYVFGESEWPLILVILGSVLMGGLIVGLVGVFRVFALQRKVRSLEKENAALKAGADKESAEVAADSDEDYLKRDIH
ncbi:LapA family protein [Bacillus infantis]|uniref:LapA family protein n=1 Tax=Bacillus infantis TaxID=324767 RepID=UPI0021552F1C|nr:lipopolysaccharide assembly protein LapA domain-containing protein [Bacillus infantis]